MSQTTVEFQSVWRVVNRWWNYVKRRRSYCSIICLKSVLYCLPRVFKGLIYIYQIKKCPVCHSKSIRMHVKWKSKTRVMSYELRVQIHELRVQIHELWVQIHELRVQIHELRVQIHELRVQIHELRVQIHELRVRIHELRVKIHELED